MDGTGLVVGFDESAGGRGALAWAIAEGARTGQPVRAVHALSWPYGPYADARDRALTHAELDRRYRAAVERAFAGVAGGTGATLELDHGDAGPVLVERSRGAWALVVGRPDHAGISRLLVGSVAHHCLTHAHCPVVTVPPGAHAGRARPTPSSTPAHADEVAVGRASVDVTRRVPVRPSAR